MPHYQLCHTPLGAAPEPVLSAVWRRLLQFNPSKRLSAEDALRHPYVAQFHAAHDEPCAAGVITIPINDNTKVRARSHATHIPRPSFHQRSHVKTIGFKVADVLLLRGTRRCHGR